MQIHADPDPQSWLGGKRISHRRFLSTYDKHRHEKKKLDKDNAGTWNIWFSNDFYHLARESGHLNAKH